MVFITGEPKTLFASGRTPTAGEQDTVFASSTYGPKQTQHQKLPLASNMLRSPAVRHLLLANKILDSPAVAVDQSDTAATWLPLANKVISSPVKSFAIIALLDNKHRGYKVYIGVGVGAQLR